MLNTIQKATLMNALQIPLVFLDIIDGRDELCGDMQYSIHEAISDMQPDTALLAIALSAQKIANIYKGASPSTKVLNMEIERLIEEYGEPWLQNEKNEKEIDGFDLYDTLACVSEDLESLAELLDLNASFLRAKDPVLAKLLDILYIQAGAHAMIAEDFIRATNEIVEEIKTGTDNALIADNKTKTRTNNIIPFPRGRH